jgi:glycosyltransferase involved in cell wall biosynthesis
MHATLATAPAPARAPRARVVAGLRVAMVNNYLYLRGGSERVLFDETRWLEEEGQTVTHFGQATPGLPAFAHADLFPPVVECTRWRGIQKLTGALRLIRNADAGRRFTAFLDRVRPDVVHCHNIYGGLTTAILDACRRRSVPCVVTLHDYKLACPSYRMLNHGAVCRRCVGGRFDHCLRRGCHKDSRAVSLVSAVEACYNEWLGKYRQAAVLLAPSRFLLARMQEHGLPATKLRWLPNGIDPRPYAPCYEDRGYLLYLGRLSPEKGGRTLIDAVAGTGVQTCIVGDGPERDAWQARAQARQAANVVFAGYQGGPELAALVRGALAVVVPSEWYENASMAVLEAMAYGKPVIGAAIGGIPEQVRHGETGLLFAPGDVDQLRAAILALAGDRPRRLAMGRAARARLERRFSLAQHGAALLRVYHEIMN